MRPWISVSARVLLVAALGAVLLATLSPVSAQHVAAQVHLFGDVHDFLATGDVRTILVQVGGNVALFMPVGFLAPLAIRTLDSAGRVTLAVVGLSAAVETTQYLLPIGRTPSIDDVVLNTVRGIAGYLLLGSLRRFAHETGTADSTLTPLT